MPLYPVPSENSAGGSAIDLVEVAPGLAVVFADAPFDAGELIPFEGRTAGRDGLADSLALGVGAMKLVAPALDGLGKAQGLVRLSPETLAALRTASPVVKDGWNLGVLQQGGKFATQVRWAPVATAQATTVMAAMGPALVLVALQAQLASISHRVDENIDLTHKVLQAIHQDQWMTLRGLHDTTLNALHEAETLGFVNDHVFATVSTREADLRKQQHLFRALVTSHVRELDTDAKGRRGYVVQNADQITADAQGLLMAEWSWYRYQVLRAAHIARDTDHADENEKLLQKLVADAEATHVEAIAELGRLLDELDGQLHLAAEIQSTSPLARIQRSKAHEAASLAEQVSRRLAQLQGRMYEPRQPVEPALLVFDKEVPADVLALLRWIVPRRESVVAFADLNYGRISINNAYLVVTDQRLLVAGQRSLRGEGEVDHDIPLADVRYVRLRHRGKQGPSLDVISKDVDLSFTFDDWAADGAGLAKAERLADLLGSVMRLPADEITSDALSDQLRRPDTVPVLEIV